jgi:hypothetical protein
MHSINNSLQSALINGFQPDLDKAMAAVCRKRVNPVGPLGPPACMPRKTQKLQRSWQMLNPPNALRPPRPLRPLRPPRLPEPDDEHLIASAKMVKVETVADVLFEVFEKEAKPKSG